MNVEELIARQNLPLEDKIKLSQDAIRQFYDFFDGKVYVSYSGGKDSTVLLHLVRQLYPEVLAVFCDTGLEFTLIKEHVKATKNVTWIRPKMSFYQVITTKGYPVISKEQACYIREYRTTKSDYLKNVRWNGKGPKHQFKISERWKFLVNAPFLISEECCDIQKKAPFKKFEKETGLRPFVGTMATDSRMRWKTYLETGCNNFKRAAGEQSVPLGFWTEKDIWLYLREKNVPYCSIYDLGAKKTGCIYCMFGIHLEEESRFAFLKRVEPKLYRYCMDTLGIGDVLRFIGYNFNQNKLTSYSTILGDKA